MIILFSVSKTFWRKGMTLRQRIKLKKMQRQKVAPVCDFKKVSYLAGIIVEQSSGYRCLCFLLCSLNKTKSSHVSLLLFRNRLQKTSKYGKHRRQTRLLLVCHFFWLFFCFVLFCFFSIGFYPILTSALIYYWTNARQHGIYLLNRFWLKLVLQQAYGHYRL